MNFKGKLSWQKKYNNNYKTINIIESEEQKEK